MNQPLSLSKTDGVLGVQFNSQSPISGGQWTFLIELPALSEDDEQLSLNRQYPSPKHPHPSQPKNADTNLITLTLDFLV